MQQSQSVTGRNFRVGRWLVQPDLNRVSDDGEQIQLEPKAMDLLVFLAEHPGEVVNREQIIEAVWRQDFVGDSTLSSAVAVLRRALDDDVRAPRYIETIAKRGYRLVAEVVHEEALATVTPFPGLVAPRERSPYPGLSAFTESDAEHFFGREEEVAALWTKITDQRLLAVIGPSGVGKSSFVRAGVIPSAPEGRACLAFAPGEAPFNSMARALAPEFSGDAEAVQQLLSFHDPDMALALVSRWRERSNEAVLFVDQFEELFTLNPAEVQVRFAELLARLVKAADVHVVLVMRDDFLYECHAHPGLAPVYRDLTVLGPLDDAALRRALVEPARHEGYRFEDESLVDEMVAEVSGERGATPMLAFAVSRLWEERNRERKLITRQSSERIGGVSGALAQRAEQVVDAIGEERLPVAREIFRNLVTAQSTRAARDVEELLSVFEDDRREAAEVVLRELVRGRLLTAFEVPAATEASSAACHRVEIVHESLLTTWPRVVRWQTQDADAAQLRDQVRQAARLWHEHGRSRDLLWTGSAYHELRLWQERYPGGLSAIEQAFVAAGTTYDGRRRRRRRALVAGLFLAVLSVAVTVTTLWRRSTHHARIVEARRLFQIGKQRLDASPPEALAYAIASLELHDDPEVRRLARDALASGPMPFAIDYETFDDYPVTVDFSANGHWLAAGSLNGMLGLWSSSGEHTAPFKAHPGGVMPRFTPDSHALVTMGTGDPQLSVWSVPEARLLHTIAGFDPLPPRDIDPSDASNNSRLLHIVPDAEVPSGWGIDWRPTEILTRLAADRVPRGALSPDGQRVVYAIDRNLFELATTEAQSEPALVARCVSTVEHVAFDPEGKRFATADVEGAVEIWDLATPGAASLRRWIGPRDAVCNNLRFCPRGYSVCATYDNGVARIWGLSDPPGADPMWMSPAGNRMIWSAFHPTGRWLATASMTRIGLWPLDRSRYPFVLRGHSSVVEHLEFAPDGSFLVSSSPDGTVRLWPRRQGPGEEGRVLFDWGHSMQQFVGWMDLSPDGRFIIATGGESSAVLIPLDGSPVIRLGGFDQRVLRTAIGPDSRLVATPGRVDGRLVVRLWDLVGGGFSDLPAEEVHGSGLLAHGTVVAFTPEGDLLAGDGGRLVRWDLATGQASIVTEGVGLFRLASSGSAAISHNAVDRQFDQPVSIHDLVTGAGRELTSHGRDLLGLALDPTGSIAVTGGGDGIVRVGRATGEMPHHLVGHRGSVLAVAVSPDGQWIASGGTDGTIRLWPMPDLEQRSLHDLSHREFLAHLDQQTNLRVVVDEEHPEGRVKAMDVPIVWE